MTKILTVLFPAWKNGKQSYVFLIFVPYYKKCTALIGKNTPVIVV